MCNDISEEKTHEMVISTNLEWLDRGLSYPLLTKIFFVSAVYIKCEVKGIIDFFYQAHTAIIWKSAPA